MEFTRKRSRELLKGKLLGLQRGNKASSTASNKAKPSLSSSSTSGTVGYVQAHQDHVIAQPKPRVSFVVADNKRGDLVAQLEDTYRVAADESVDNKASLYISRVQERFKLDRLSSERVKFHESSVSSCFCFSVLGDFSVPDALRLLGFCHRLHVIAMGDCSGISILYCLGGFNLISIGSDPSRFCPDAQGYPLFGFIQKLTYPQCLVRAMRRKLG